tara:strand:+ start:720 stop:1007 length:288 start_codon:yes stop_codon:yes gene_type:complete
LTEKEKYFKALEQYVLAVSTGKHRVIVANAVADLENARIDLMDTIDDVWMERIGYFDDNLMTCEFEKELALMAYEDALAQSNDIRDYVFKSLTRK